MKAKNGQQGGGRQCSGKAAADKIVKVPVGTIVYRLPGEEPDDTLDPSLEYGTNSTYIDFTKSPERVEQDRQTKQKAAAVNPEELEMVVDLTEPGQRFVLCQGGKGGIGNVHFKSSRNRAPREYTEGQEGESGHFLLELRTIADAGLIGYPNAGKSTLLRKISAARPKVAAYPFTTLHPVIGVVEFSEYRRATIADIPGLIEGAHRGLGLGHEFLRHITRCRIFLFVVDVAGSEGRNPVEDLQQLRKELDLYDPLLSQRPWFVIANKMDLPGADENLTALRKKSPKIDIVPVSAATGEGIDGLKTKLAKWLEV